MGFDTMEYGRINCKHEFRYRKDGHEEQCLPIICIKCGAYGCYCDAMKYWRDNSINPWTVEKFLQLGEFRIDSNINGNWNNPYIKPLPRLIKYFMKKMGG